MCALVGGGTGVRWVAEATRVLEGLPFPFLPSSLARTDLVGLEDPRIGVSPLPLARSELVLG